MEEPKDSKGGHRYDALKLENLICFPLYACARELVKLYKPFLDEIDLTYTQYITMIVLWEKETLTSKELGRKLFLDSGTLTPLLKKLEGKGYITRNRSAEDERNLVVTLTQEGRDLFPKGVEVYRGMVGQFRLDEGDTRELYRLLYKVMKHDKELPENFMEIILREYIGEEPPEE